MKRLPPISSLTDTLFPYSTIFRSFIEQRLKDVGDRLERQCLGDIADELGRCRLQGVEQFLHLILPQQLARLALQDLVDMGCDHGRSEEHTSELQSLMRISYAVFCLKKKIVT